MTCVKLPTVQPKINSQKIHSFQNLRVERGVQECGCCEDFVGWSLCVDYGASVDDVSAIFYPYQ